MRDAFFHEDDYCQLELLPDGNWEFCQKQMQELEKFSEAHKTEFGWTDMFCRSENPQPLSELAIDRAVLTRAVSALLPPFDRVLTYYAGTSSECQSTIAFGHNRSLVLFAEVGENEIIKAVWFTFDLVSADDVEFALSACKAISQWPVIIADWGWCQLHHIGDEAALSQYFNLRLRVFGEAR